MASISTPRICPCLWFDGNAEPAADFYTSLIPNSAIESVSRYSAEAAKQMGIAEGSAMVVMFRLDGQLIMGLNGGPMYPLTPAVSLVLNCADQVELDHYWDRLLVGGKTSQCGWLTDRYGLSWQVLPRGLSELLSRSKGEAGQRVMAAMMLMVKLDIAALAASAEG
jgi:predicted 3-demethylubiquinone-9 3-methyltransferase (glyoxalase superfamily)